jgi:ribosomal protein S6
MAETGNLLEYTGLIDYRIIDQLLNKFKKSGGYVALDKTIGKRTYAILVECLENIAKHSVKESSVGILLKPSVSVRKLNNKILIKASNPVAVEKTGELIRRLNQVNYLNEKVLNTLFDNRINKGAIHEENGAGLGFMLMKLKSGNKITYKFTRIDSAYTNFEIKISINEHIMRKLIINQTPSSPKVILDPDSKIFEISGESRPPDVSEFYGEVLSWLDDYNLHLSKSHDVKDPVEFNLDIEYFNSSSAKYILDFCKQLAQIRSKGKDLTVRWHYEEDDMDMLQVGREMSRMSKVPFDYIKKDIT